MKTETLPSFRVVLVPPRHGYWDGGAKSGGEFHPELHYPEDPGRSYVKYGCYEMNHWFNLPLHYEKGTKKGQPIPRNLLIRQIRKQLCLSKHVSGYIEEIKT